MMESGCDGCMSNSESEGDICKKISKFMKDHHYSAEPVVDIVEADSVRHVESSACNEDFDDDELNDILEEQMLLKKIKHLKDYRKSLAYYRDPELDKVDHRIKPKIESNDEVENETKISQSSFDNDEKIFECILPTCTTDSRQVFETCNRFESLTKLSKASAINVLMQSELTTLESVLMERLKEVIKEQIEVRAEISRMKFIEKNNVKKNSRKIVWYTLFGRPYFKDEQRYSCPMNEDAKRMKFKNQILTVNLFQNRPWRIKDKYNLEEGVRKILIEEQANKFYEKENELKNQLKNDICNTKMKKKIRSELQCIHNKIEILEKKSLKELFSLCEPDREFDWLKIAAKDVPKHSSEECQRMWHLYVKPTINKKRFTHDEDSNLTKLIEKYGDQSWDIIAKKLKTSRTEFLCFFNYKKRLLRGRDNCGKWTKEEDCRLLGIVKKLRIGDFIPWPKVSFYFEGRSLRQLYTRWTHSINPDLKKGRFNKIEDRMIISSVRKYGENFTKIAKLLGYRNSTQVRQRYYLMNILNFNVGRWSLEEDETLLALVEKYGVSRWSVISKQFLTRTRTQIRHRYRAIKNFMKKYPNHGIEDIQRGPAAKSQYLLPVGAAEVKAACKEQENKMLSELVKESKINGSTKTHDIAITKLKRGRKKCLRRSKLDMKLLAYFKEVFKTDKLKLRTHYVKPDINKAANALMLFCSYFKTSLILSGDEFNKAVKNLPTTLKSVVFKMIENEKGCNNFRAKLVDVTSNSVVPDSYDLATVNGDSHFIDCLPVDPKDTLISEYCYFLSDYKDETELDEITVNGERSKTLNVIPFFLPPSIITMIGCRSLILIKGKIMCSLVNKCTRPNFFFPNDESLMKKNNLKFFNGYFSEDEAESDCDGDINIENHSENESIKLLVEDSLHDKNCITPGTPSFPGLLSGPSIDLNPVGISNETSHPLPSTFDECGPSSPSILFSDSPFLYEVENEKHTVEQRKDKIMDVRRKRLSKQEAIDLWKERLMVLFGWPLALANHVQGFPEDEINTSEIENNINENENNTKKIEINSNEVKQPRKPQHNNNNNTKISANSVFNVKGSIKSVDPLKCNLLPSSPLICVENQSKRPYSANKRDGDINEKQCVSNKVKNIVAHKLPSSYVEEVDVRETSIQNGNRKSKRIIHKTNTQSGFSDRSNVADCSGKVMVDNSVTHDEPLTLSSKRRRKSNKFLSDYKVYK